MAKEPISKCVVASQVILAGPQEVSARAFGRHEGWVTSYISLRVGRVIFNVEDRVALHSMVEAVRQAQQLAEQAFGPDWVRRR